MKNNRSGISSCPVVCVITFLKPLIYDLKSVFLVFSNQFMKTFTPFFVALRVVGYSLLMFGIAEGILFDAAHPMDEGYFGEITIPEIGQEVILFILFLFYLFLGFRWPDIQPVSNIVSLFFLISFIREFNFLIDGWIYPALLVLGIIGWLVFRDWRKLKQATPGSLGSGLGMVFLRFFDYLHFQPPVWPGKVLAAAVPRRQLPACQSCSRRRTGASR
jgi:hypothetical protein